MKIICTRAGKCDNTMSSIATPPTCQGNLYRPVKGREGGLPVFASKITFFEKEQLSESHMFLTPTSFHHVPAHPMSSHLHQNLGVPTRDVPAVIRNIPIKHRLFTFGPTLSLTFKVSFKDKTSIRTIFLSACKYNMRLNSPYRGQGQGLKAAPGIPVVPWISVDRPALSNQP